MEIALIAAYSKNRVIGKNGKIPWDIPGEQSRFRELTTGNIVIMGRKTYEEIGHPLPDRTNIVITKKGLGNFSENSQKDTPFYLACSIEEAVELAEKQSGAKKIFVSGGARLYKECLNLADRMYITEIETECEGDTFFPVFDETQFTKQVVKNVPGKIPYRYVTYTRVTQQI